MIYLIVAVILFIIADLVIRNILKNTHKKRLIQEREAALDKSLRLDFSHEAKSLKRVDVENPKARILCVDDEDVVLDSFRKILVLDGYSIDTVTNGKEALGLVQTHQYDFVFIDLKMPEMSGVEVTKAIRHIRPDIDVVIITGYATIESAVETMKHGAMDYVQKPFTDEELLQFTKKCLLKRQESIKEKLKPKVFISSISEFGKGELGEFLIPGGVFISEGHCWLSLNQDGTVKVGIDDFAKKVIGRIDNIDFPNLGRHIKKGDSLFSVKRGTRIIPFNAPLSGKIIKVNSDLNQRLDDLDITPYDRNWVCVLEANNLDKEVKELKIGKTAVSFFQNEIEKCIGQFKELIKDKKSDKIGSEDNGHYTGIIEKISMKESQRFINMFFKRI